jgi:Mn2+/Fe2+ NRAMP family transporter
MAGSADVLTALATTKGGALAAGLNGNPALWAVIIAAVVVVILLSLRSSRR